MKYLLIFLFAFSFSTQSDAQSLQGIWQGQFQYDGFREYVPTYIALKIDSLNDGTYEIHSYTRLKLVTGGDTVIVCRVEYQQPKANLIILREYEFLNADLAVSALQTMFLKLKLKKGKSMLTGRWESPDELNLSRKMVGRITFTRMAAKD